MIHLDALTAVPARLLLGSGPSIVPSSVLEALALPTIGHMDPAFAEVMSETIDMLRTAFGTSNAATLPISGTGSAGMEALVANFVDPGDRVVCGVHGLFGLRMADELERAGARVIRVEAPWGRAIETEALIAAARAGLDAMVLVHGETSTGVAQPLDGLAEACREHDALLLIDAVTSLGGHPLNIDAAGIDAAFSGTQKCLNCPPGLAPFTAGERALAKLRRRSAPGRSWYFDLALVLGYWNPAQAGAPARAYHHTAPINLIYALRESLHLLLREGGLETTWERHRRAHHALKGALEVLGCTRLAPEGQALHPLLAVTPPAEIDEALIRTKLLLEHGIEISGGLGPLAGRLWRIGVMGAGAHFEPQARLVGALSALLAVDPADPLAALAEGWRSGT
ncbi:MAG: pyridoxal-phosphate-dependent aminotransferase family protein [Sporichthyaceae bacterium]